MKSISKKLIVISFFLAFIAAIAIVTYLQSIKAPKTTVDKNISIIVAKENIAERTLIEEKMLKEIKVPDNDIFKNNIKDYSKIIGKYLNVAILKDQGFREENLIDKEGNEISAKINKDNRAVSINVTGASAVSDLLKAGDYVDVITTLPEKKEQDKVVRPDISKVIIENIQVIAVNKQISREENQEKNKENQEVPDRFLVTLLVPASEVEKIVLAESIGTIKLALRSMERAENMDSDGAKWQDVIGNEMDNKTQEKNIEEKNVEENFVMYTVKRGDTLRNISLEFYGTKDKYYLIKKVNNMSDNQIVTGKLLKIPLN